MKKRFRLLTVILVFSMILPGFVFSENTNLNVKDLDIESSNTEEYYDELVEVKPILDEALQTKKIEGELDELFDSDDEVRIIIELEDSPIITYATESGVSINELSKSKVTQIENRLETNQVKVKRNIASSNIKMEYLNSFTTVFNGFSGKVKYGELDLIKRIPGVKKVYISNEYKAPEVQPEMITSHDMIGSGKTWDLNYKGEGMVVSVIDTGVDPSHRDMVITKGTEVALTEELINQIIAKNPGMKGEYFTEKVPFGYNYYDLNNEILDKRPNASEHGMHVAGTVGANGNVENGGIKGVAPEAQILAMKVFSNDPVYSTTFGDIYLKAIEDSVKLGSNVINMSLGSTAAFYDPESAENKAITNAVNNGIVCAISAGNSGQITYGWDKNNGLPFKENPDIGLVGAPGLSVDSLQVASIENTKMMSPYLQFEGVSSNGILPLNSVIVEDSAYDIKYLNNNSEAQTNLIAAYNSQKPVYIKLSESTIVDVKGQIADSIALPTVVKYYDKDGKVTTKSTLNDNTSGEIEGNKIPMIIAGDVKPGKVFDGPVEFVDCGIGTEEDIAKANVKNKVALIVRGVIPFTDKISNANKAGASAVVVYNHADGGEELLNMLYPAGVKIPAVFIGYNGGSALLGLKDKKISFANDLVHTDNYSAGLMSEFTSWGTTPGLELKPEITAPGGQIYSTLQNNRYGMMSGTSMSSPHVAGGSALVMEYIKNHDEYKNLTPEQQARFAKLLLMNTADIIKNPDFNGVDKIVSPRRQGAGLMNLYSTVLTPVTLFDSSTKEGKVELKDFEETSFTMNLIVENHSDKELTYKVNVDVLTDDILYDEDLDTEFNVLSSRKIDAQIEAPNTIIIPANNKKEFMVTVDFSKDELKYRNMFVEGFVSLEETTNTYPTLSLPYMGFYGEWNEPSILDGMKGMDEKSYYEMAGMAGINKDYEISYYEDFVMSPYTDDGKLFGKSLMFPILSLMRNARKMEFNILDKNKEKLTTLYRDEFIAKSYVDGGHNLPAYLIVDAVWDGKIGKSIMPDGQYYYQIRTIIDYENAEYQEKEIPILIDTEKPEISNVSFDEESKVISWNATDSGSGVVAFLVTLNGSQVGEVVLAEDEVSDYQFDLSQYMEETGFYNVKLFALDKAMNTTVISKEINLENSEPEIYLLRPGLFEVSKGDVPFKGYVFGTKDVQSIKIDNEEISFGYNDDLVLMNPNDEEKVLRRGPGYTFSEVKTYESGIYEIPVTVTTKAGQEKTIIRRFYVDTEDPNLICSVLERDETSETVESEVTRTDIFPYV